MQIITVYHTAGQGAGMLVALLVGIVFLTGLAQYIFAQVALLELPFGGMLKNAVLLFLGYLPRTALGIVWQLAYCLIVALFWPFSSVLLVITGCWLPTLLSLMAIYPVLDKSFHVEETVKKNAGRTVQGSVNFRPGLRLPRGPGFLLPVLAQTV